MITITYLDKNFYKIIIAIFFVHYEIPNLSQTGVLTLQLKNNIYINKEDINKYISCPFLEKKIYPALSEKMLIYFVNIPTVIVV